MTDDRNEQMLEAVRREVARIPDMCLDRELAFAEASAADGYPEAIAWRDALRVRLEEFLSK